MLTLNPAESFPIVRVLGNHTDTATYFVQAVIRDATTDVILDTVNLTDLGNRRFRKAWKVVYDNTFSAGRYIIITTTVYTDSGYTTKSENYSEEVETYLVQQRWNMATMAGLGGGGSPVIDYKEVRKIIVEELAKIVEKLAKIEFSKTETSKPVDMSIATKEIIKTTSDKVDKIEITVLEKLEKLEKIDLYPLEKGLEKIIKEISMLPRFEKTDLTPIIKASEKINKISEDLKTEIANTRQENRRTANFLNGLKIVAGEAVDKKENYLQKLKSQFI